MIGLEVISMQDEVIGCTCAIDVRTVYVQGCTYGVRTRVYVRVRT